MIDESSTFRGTRAGARVSEAVETREPITVPAVTNCTGSAPHSCPVHRLRR
jgi:hypothetical protein